MNDFMFLGIYCLWKDFFVLLMFFCLFLFFYCNFNDLVIEKLVFKCLDVVGGMGDIVLRILDWVKDKFVC